jgi:multicomponent K+:H+ antiporter subunit D
VLASGLLGIVALARSGSMLFFRADGAAAPAAGGGLLALGPPVGLLAVCLVLLVWASPILSFSQATAEQLLQPQDYVRAVLGPPTEVDRP